jgi:hypothetical protein
MSIRPAGLAVTLLLAFVPSLSAQSQGTPQQKRTVADIRNVGTALFSWLTDQVADAEGTAQDDVQTGPCGEEVRECKIVDMEQVPVISREDLIQILVPTYIQEVPEKDAWGNPYEYRLETKKILNQRVMSIRSPGRDGVFSGDRYDVDGFAPSQESEDLVWVDGFFARWPEREKERKR